MKNKESKNQLHEVYSALCLAEGIIENIYGEVDDLWQANEVTSEQVKEFGYSNAELDRFQAERAIDDHRYFLQELLDLVQTLTNKTEFDKFK